MKLIGYWAVGGEKNRQPGGIFVSLPIYNSGAVEELYIQRGYTLIPSYID